MTEVGGSVLCPRPRPLYGWLDLAYADQIGLPMTTLTLWPGSAPDTYVAGGQMARIARWAGACGAEG